MTTVELHQMEGRISALKLHTLTLTQLPSPLKHFDLTLTNKKAQERFSIKQFNLFTRSGLTFLLIQVSLHFKASTLWPFLGIYVFQLDKLGSGWAELYFPLTTIIHNIKSPPGGTKQANLWGTAHIRWQESRSSPCSPDSGLHRLQ